jgi:tellurite resistance protein
MASVGDVVLRLLVRVAGADGILGASESEMLLRVAGTLGFPEEAARRTIEEEMRSASEPESLGRAVAPSGHARSVLALGYTMALADGELADRERALLDGFARGAGISAADAAAIRAETARAAVEENGEGGDEGD